MKPSELICKRFAFSQDQLQAYAQTCPYRYKTYPIKKRSGGTRLISQPSKDLKAVQRFILDEFLSPLLEVHDAAKAYKAKTNILDNARPHLKNQYLLKLDFKDFFPSILAQDFVFYLISKGHIIDKREADILARIFFKQEGEKQEGEVLRLSIGSPGSPIISNALLYSFDGLVTKRCELEGIAYSRYSDDLTFSTNRRNTLFSWPEKIASILATINNPTLILNDDKTVFSSKKFNRHVTGITITNEGVASIGRDKKRELRSRVFEASKLNPKELAQLQGHIAFATHVEPEFLEKLLKKYPVQMELVIRRN